MGFASTYWYVSSDNISLNSVVLRNVTDDPGSKPDQKYAPRRDRQNC